MSTVRMHAEEFDTDPDLVRRLLVAQFPQWSGLAIKRVVSAGTDNALYRLGDDMVVRLPRTQSATGQVDKERTWLPALALHLPLEIPAPLATGAPGEGFPWNWAVHRWIVGENATLDRLSDPVQSATTLASFVKALHHIDTGGGPVSGRHNFYRGVPLVMRDEPTRTSIDALRGVIDTGVATRAWEQALQAPVWSGAPVWVHGDLQSGNLLARHGEITAVIDFGGLGVGDPAVDLIVAWNLFDPDSRDAYKKSVQADEATWARGRGWALSTSLIALPYYHITNPVLAGIARYAINQVLAEQAASG